MTTGGFNASENCLLFPKNSGLRGGGGSKILTVNPYRVILIFQGIGTKIRIAKIRGL